MRSLADLPGPETPAGIQTLLAMLPPLRRLERFHARYGDIFRVEAWVPRGRHDRRRGPLVRATTVVLSAPEDLRDAFTADADTLTAGDARGFLEWWVRRDSALVLDGEEHRRERRSMRELLGPQRLAVFEQRISTAAADTLAALPARGHLELGPLLDDLVVRSALAIFFGSVDERMIQTARHLVAASIDAPAWAGAVLMFPALRRDLGRWSPGGRAAGALRGFEALIAEQVARRAEGAICPGEDLLGHLLSPDDPKSPELEAQRHSARMISMFGQFFTTSAALRWCALRLVEDREIWNRAAEEARRTEPVATARTTSYLDAICRETLRLHSPFPFAIRRARAPVVVAGCLLPTGTYVAPSMYLAHRRPQVYPEPARFHPERFLERSFSPWEFLPFGGGSRRCIGDGLALRQMVVLLTSLLRTLELHPQRRFGLAERRRSIALLPRDPLPIEFRRTAQPPAFRHAAVPACPEHRSRAPGAAADR